MLHTMVTASRAVTLLLVATTVLTVSCRRVVDDARAVAGAARTAVAGPDGSDSSGRRARRGVARRGQDLRGQRHRPDTGSR